ncbi:uroporphyrinogen-III synthase [Promicromonospora iranensis]|uniref:Uroporphyrinogen-III synthase n=1 Tax=Promicromonospora iranensis TaxID=1105144 RepID=A0ABU2CP50_9MICO|nr:uroporphyrinogen-III synthase [Promicromonospora iranensis]MDR7383100.1 uroporphyrinogen-III synthase [Promicromonospora iranensis]
MTEPDPRTAGRPRADDQPDVLVARAPEQAAGLLTLLRERGLHPVAAPVIERAAVDDPAELDAARSRLAQGRYAWVAITSVNAADALLGPAPSDAAAREATQPPAEGRTSGDASHDTSPDTPGTTRWAAVGPATRRALTERGVLVELVPSIATGAGLAEAFPQAPGTAGSSDVGPTTQPRVLLPLGNLASGTLRTGLEAKGWAVDVVTAYRTVTRELPAELRRPYDVVVVASGSAARQVAAQLGPQRVVTIGEPSARAAGAAGHTVLAVAAAPTDEALADAVTEALVRT